LARTCSARSWAFLSLAAFALACGGSERRAAPTATPVKDCRGAAALVNGCPEPDGVERGAARGAPCARTAPLGLVEPCVFGRKGGETFALIGDSHANALRSAFAVAADRLGWRGYALTRNGCPYVRDGRALPEPDFSECATFKQQVPAWLAQHPEVTTVFVIGLPRNAASQDPALWVAAWQALPVERIVVLRDTPELREDTLACVNAATAKPGSTCAVPRATALAPDPAVSAAAQLGARTIDLSRHFCDEDRCFPVVGGVLAYQDLTHVTPAFAATLGPFLTKDLERLG
jgi:SGNH domain (fused to AT3 domains)